MVNELDKIKKFLETEEKITWEDIAWLEIQSKQYPFFQSLHLWIAKHYHQEDHILKSNKIQSASTYAVDRNVFRNRLLNKKEFQKTDKEIVFTAPIPKIEKPIQETKEKTREELLAAVHARLAELQKNKSIEPDLSEPISTSLEIVSENIESKIEQIPKRSKETLLVESNPEIKEEIPELKKVKTPRKTASETRKDKEEKIKADEDLKKIISDSIKPKDLFYSRLGNELNIDSTDSIDLLLNYLESQKEKKAGHDNLDKKESIIEKFIKNDPKISKLTADKKGEGEDLTANLFSNKKFISENLAKIQAKQGYTKEAIEIYEELMLKFPEKKTYFAEQIKNLK